VSRVNASTCLRDRQDYYGRKRTAVLQTRFSADAERQGIDLAAEPIDNLITEFVPSTARPIHIHVVFVQRMINQVAVNPP
jgi:hypothetical protein